MSAILEASDEDFAPGPNVATVRDHVSCIECNVEILLALYEVCDHCAGIDAKTRKGHIRSALEDIRDGAGQYVTLAPIVVLP